MNNISVKSMLSSIVKNRKLILTLIKRSIESRYRGSMFGLVWPVLLPILMLLIYTFVFSVVFNARWGSDGSTSRVEFALILFAGLIIFNFFAECFSNAPCSILANSNYVKKVVFPLEILSIVNVGTALFHLIISLVVWFIFYIVEIGIPHVTVLLFPLVLLPLILLTLGVSWLLSGLGVYFRDVNVFVSVIITLMMFLSPIFYPESAIPDGYKMILNCNPLVPIIDQAREVLFYGHSLAFVNYIFYLVLDFIIMWIGYFCFQLSREGFADVV